jgi:hypothetical protein
MLYFLHHHRWNAKPRPGRPTIQANVQGLSGLLNNATVTPKQKAHFECLL